MNDIMINTGLRKFLYYYAIVCFFLFGGGVIWLIALIFYVTQKDVPKKQDALNKTYQKIIWFYGLIAGTLIITVISFVIQLSLLG